jgi:ABC-2 type transport system permease protein
MTTSSTSTKTSAVKPATPPTAPPLQATMDAGVRAILSSGTRPKRPNALSVSLTFGWRALLKIKHVPMQLFDVTAFPIMFTLLFTYLFGGALAGSTGEYLQFLLPGILVQTVVFITMYTGVALNTDIAKGIFDRVRTLPIWRPSALVGALLGDVVRYTLASTIVIVLGLVLGFRPAGGVLGVLFSVVLLLVFSFSLSWVWTLLGLVMKTPESVMGVSSMVIFPLTFVSNIFVDPVTMPGWLEGLVALNPITHLVTAVRGLMAGTVTTGQVGWVLLSAALFTAVFAPLTMRRYNRKG